MIDTIKGIDFKSSHFLGGLLIGVTVNAFKIGDNVYGIPLIPRKGLFYVTPAWGIGTDDVIAFALGILAWKYYDKEAGAGIIAGSLLSIAISATMAKAPTQ